MRRLAWPPVKGSVLTIESDEPGQPALAIDEQIQLYCPNVLLSHPLVSPVNQGSLGGLCPLLIVSARNGGGMGCQRLSLATIDACSTPAVASFCAMSRSTSLTRQLIRSGIRRRRLSSTTIRCLASSSTATSRRGFSCRYLTGVLM